MGDRSVSKRDLTVYRFDDILLTGEAMGHDLARTIRAAIEADGRSLYALARAAGLRYSVLHRFVRTPDAQLRTDVASRLCGTLGLRLTADRRERK